jgi:SPP1 family predicted phage head-tail adaptor
MKIGAKTTNPGELRTLITLQHRTVPAGTGGFQVPTWSMLAEVYCRWINAHGVEALTASSIGAEMPATLLIRYIDRLDMTCSVLKGDLTYEIISIDDIQERHEYLELKVKRMRSG